MLIKFTSAWRPSPKSGGAAQPNSVGWHSRQPGMGETNPQITIILWFSFLRIDREEMWKPSTVLQNKTPYLGLAEAACPGLLQDMATEPCRLRFRLERAPHRLGLVVARANWPRGSCTETAGRVRHQGSGRHENIKWENKLNHHILWGDVNGWQLSHTTSASVLSSGSIT